MPPAANLTNQMLEPCFMQVALCGRLEVERRATTRTEFAADVLEVRAPYRVDRSALRTKLLVKVLTEHQPLLQRKGAWAVTLNHLRVDVFDAAPAQPTHEALETVGADEPRL